MRKELFMPYLNMIMRCIESCVHLDQLHVCHDMTDRFKEQFMYLIDPKKMDSAINEIHVAYLQKQAEIA